LVHAAARLTLTVGDASLFSSGAYICNVATMSALHPLSARTLDVAGTGDSRTLLGYKILTSCATDNTLVLANAVTSHWGTGDVIRGYLPPSYLVGRGGAIENNDTAVQLNQVSATIKSSDITVSAPKQYITDEVGILYPANYMENQRAITFTMGLYFREADAAYFQSGYDGSTSTVRLIFGSQQGDRMMIYMPKAKLAVPTVTPAPPAVELSLSAKALGIIGEDSFELHFM
jgi:hypothetical protein